MRRLSRLLLSGLRAFDPGNFTAVGQEHQRRFFRAVGGFVAALVAMALVTLIGLWTAT